jgi:AcrR family transcriptional regulator
LAEVCAVKGYRAATVEDIITHAGVSRRTFYDLFADKQQCFLVAYDVITDRLFDAVNTAYWEGDREWPERLAAALTRLLELLAAEPVFARLVMVEALVAGRPALQRRDAMLKRFEVFFGPGRAGLPVAFAEQQLLARAVIGGVAETLYTRIVARDAERLPELGPELIYCALVPYLGHAKAIAAIANDRS